MEVNSDDSGFEEQAEAQPKPSFDFTTRPQKPVKQPDLLPALTVQPLSGYGSSLLPDMLFGWRPKVVHGGPIPLIFNKAELPVLRGGSSGEENEVVFHGFRPKDTLALHTKFASPDSYPVPTYPSMQAYELTHKPPTKPVDIRPFVGMSPSATPHDLCFDSTFESGNLDKVAKVTDCEYDLYMRADANTRGHHQWYYFSVLPHREVEAKFHILNFTKNESLYSQGMHPLVYCENDPDKGWHPGGQSISYKPSKLNSFVRRSYSSLTFSYTFTHPHSKVFFAYSIPYTYTRLCKLVRELSATGGEMRVKREFLCKTLSGVEVPLLTVTDFSIPPQRKQSVVVTGRVHPGETYGSFMMEGFLRFVVSDDPAAVFLRQKIVFHVVPMLNPDGVIMGNYRTGFAGCDLNRQFQRPDYILHPTVMAVKTLITRLWKEHDLAAFIDMHAHSKQKCVFLYGPHFPLHSDKYEVTRVIPRLICDQSPVFRFTSCRFRNERSKRKAARLVIWKEFKLATSYTVEASFYGFINTERVTVPFTDKLVMDAGVAIAKGLWEFVVIEEKQTAEREAKRRKRKRKRVKTSLEGLIRVQESPKGEAVQEGETVDVPPIESIVEPDHHSSDSSDGDSSGDDLEPADELQLHQEIAAVMQEFFEIGPPSKPPRPPRTRRNRERLPSNPQEVDAKSSLECYFSRADEPRKGKLTGKALVPKVYDPLIPIRPSRGIRSLSQRPAELILRGSAREEFGRGRSHRSSVDPGRETPSGTDLATRLGAWLRHRPPQTARRFSRDSEDESSEAIDSRLISPAPVQTKAFRGDLTHDHRPRRANFKATLPFPGPEL